MSVLFFCYQTIIDTVREKEKGLQEICLDSTPYILSRSLPSREVLRLVTDSSQKAEDHNFETGCYDCEVGLGIIFDRQCLGLLREQNGKGLYSSVAVQSCVL